MWYLWGFCHRRERALDWIPMHQLTPNPTRLHARGLSEPWWHNTGATVLGLGLGLGL